MEPDFTDLERLVRIVESAPLTIEITNWPVETVAIVAAVAGPVIAVFGAILGARVGAEMTADSTRKMMAEAETRRRQAQARDTFYRLVDVTMDSINFIEQSQRHIDEELSRIKPHDVHEAGWTVIRPRTWMPTIAETLPPECSALLIESHEVDALPVFKNIVMGAASLAGTLSRFDSLKDEFSKETDLPERENFRREGVAGGEITIDAKKQPRAFRLAQTLKSLSQELFGLLPEYHADVESARAMINGVNERHWEEWGLDRPFPGIEIKPQEDDAATEQTAGDR